MDKIKKTIFKIFSLVLIILLTSQTIISHKNFLPSFLSLATRRKIVKPVSTILQNKYKVEFKIIQGFKKGKIKIYINGHKSTVFLAPEQKVILNTGDLVWIDAREVQEPVWLRINQSQLEFRPFIQGAECRIQKELYFLGEVNNLGRR